MFTMALWKVAVVFLFVYVCFDGVNSEMIEPVDQRSLNERFLEVEKEIVRLKTTQCDGNKRLEEIACPWTTTNIAFRSVLHTNLIGMRHGSPVVFGIVELNDGTAYNQYNGIFTAPVNGIYMFSVKIGNPTNNPGTFSLIKASYHKKQFLEYVFAGYTSGWDMGGTTTVTHLVKGESVWVEGEGAAHGRIGFWRDHTTFAGVLLHIV